MGDLFAQLLHGGRAAVAGAERVRDQTQAAAGSARQAVDPRRAAASGAAGSSQANAGQATADAVAASTTAAASAREYAVRARSFAEALPRLVEEIARLPQVDDLDVTTTAHADEAAASTIMSGLAQRAFTSPRTDRVATRGHPDPRRPRVVGVRATGVRALRRARRRGHRDELQRVAPERLVPALILLTGVLVHEWDMSGDELDVLLTAAAHGVDG